MRLTSPLRLPLFTSLTIAHASTRCAIVGDSIADELRGLFRECRVDAKIGIGTAAIVARVPRDAGLIVVSAGSNDYRTPGLPARLRALRSRAGAARVIWIRPAPPAAAAAVEAIAHRTATRWCRSRSRAPIASTSILRSQRLAANIRRHFRARRVSASPDCSDPGSGTRTPP